MTMCQHIWTEDRTLDPWLDGRAEVRRCAACGEMQVRGPEGSEQRKWEVLVVGPDLPTADLRDRSSVTAF